jgi:zinc ribbon protein
MSQAADNADTQVDHGLPPWQFFLLCGMLGATAVVIVATGQPIANILILSITIVAASFVGLAAYRMLSPLIAPVVASAPVVSGGRTRAALEREKTLVLRSIKELEFDRAMGKVAQADFDEMSGRLRRRAIGLMQQLDAETGYREQIEKELASLITVPAETRTPNPERRTNPEPGTNPEPRTPNPEPAPRSCPACGTANDADARFCKQCGTSLAIS